MSARAASLLLSLLFVLPTGSADAKCAMAWMGAFLASPQDTPLPLDASLVIVERSTRENRTLKPKLGTDTPKDAKGDAALWTFSLIREGDSIALTPERIGPALIRLTPERQPEPGTWKVKGLNEEASVIFSADATHAPLAAPDVQQVSFTLSRPSRRGQRKNVSATLNTPIPEGVVAIIGYWDPAPKDSKKRPKLKGSAHVVSSGSVDVQLFEYPGRCGFTPDTVQLPNRKAGGKAVLHFVDATGQVSPASKETEIAFTEEQSP